tara:strand:- start:1850 stop:2044 length:195 start_codon:yes stop_codon:yes gene_type:complete
MLGHSIADPGRYAEDIRIMRTMGWSWEDLQNAPASLVDELQVRLNAESYWQAQKQKFDAEKATR